MMTKLKFFSLMIGLVVGLSGHIFAQGPSPRTVIDLSGTWQIAEGDSLHLPQTFSHTVAVPGLVSLAQPAFKDVAPKVSDRRKSEPEADPLRESFWYRKTFSIPKEIPDVALLKVGKAKYGTRVFVNGKTIGEHLPCFTPGYFDVREALKTGENVIVIRVGSGRASLPRSVPDGFDFEKERYIPGIYDEVQLILSGSPHIVNVQAVPDIEHKVLQVQLSLDTLSRIKSTGIDFVIKEKGSQKVAGKLHLDMEIPSSGLINARIPVKDCHLWSPEDPFLYQLTVRTAGDERSDVFGMREFHFDPVTKQAVLNGKPYFLRGTNITLYRFFEDSACKSLPWDTAWVRNLFKSFKQFHWNSMRLCIGLPPESWYKIADEEGFLLQDEFPIWYGGIGWNNWPKELKSEELAKEYTEMMQQDWNHPSVVIWDASNENVSNNGLTDETGEAVWKVRNLDLSNRPWDNSYSPHRAPGDVFESHPYHFQNADFKLKDITKADIVPKGAQYENLQDFPVIINEYGWLWLNRDGSPTTLTKQLYENLLGSQSTKEQRRHLYATYMAAETEFWRCHRQAAGVLIFTALGYSRADGQTSDFFTDPAQLKYDSAILNYLPDAFSPVGIMLDEWGTAIKAGVNHDFAIYLINDLGKNWKGTVTIQILKGRQVVKERSVSHSIPAYGENTIKISCPAPDKPGVYKVVASLQGNGSKPIRSVREAIPFK